MQAQLESVRLASIKIMCILGYNIYNYNIYYTGENTMLQTFLLALLALAVRDIFYEVVDWIQRWRLRKEINTMRKRSFTDDEEWEDFLDEVNP